MTVVRLEKPHDVGVLSFVWVSQLVTFPYDAGVAVQYGFVEVAITFVSLHELQARRLLR